MDLKFHNWFDTDYYHILYGHRDEREAQRFVDTLLSYLSLPKEKKILDMGCGRGRHAKYLNDKGYGVVGIDFSENNIDFAKQFSNDNLQFFCRNMSIPMRQRFDLILNLFTSFGYSALDRDHITILSAIKQNLNTDGLAVIDYMNAKQVISDLIAEEHQEIQGIDFHIRRYINQDYICKDIDFEDKGKSYHFKERVRGFKLPDFQKMFTSVGLNIRETFGDYSLNTFSEEASPRLIMIVD